MIRTQRSALLFMALTLGFPILTGFGPSRSVPVPLPAVEPGPGFVTAPRTDVFRLWLDPRSTAATPRVWLGTDSDSLATAGVQLWAGGANAQEVYSTRDTTSSPKAPATGRTDLTAIGFQGDRTFVALRGGNGERPTPSGTWIESSNGNGSADWRVEFTTSRGWDFFVRGFEVLATEEVVAWGTNGHDKSCGDNGLLGWFAVRDSLGHWTESSLPTSLCNEIPIGVIASREGRGIWLVTQSGVFEGLVGSQSWQRSVKWAGTAVQGKIQGGKAILIFEDGSIRSWAPGTESLPLITHAPAGAVLPTANQARWYEGHGNWDALGPDSMVWVTSSYQQRRHCHPPVIVIPMPGPIGNPCQDLISSVWSWNGRDWKVVASAYGSGMTGVLLLNRGQVLLPKNGEVRSVTLTQ